MSLLTGAATVAVMPRLFDRAEASAHGRRWLGAGLLGFALVLLLYVLLWPKRAGNVAEFDAHGVESAWTLFGTMLGLLAAWYADRAGCILTPAPYGGRRHSSWYWALRW